jgi:hypothetical protein
VRQRPLEPKRDDQDWTGQWLRALTVVVGSALVVGYYLKSGQLHPRVVYDPSGRRILVTELVPPPDSFGGVRLGMTSDEVESVKGKALREEAGQRFYNSIDDAHNGLLEVDLRNTGQGAPPVVWAVLYWGARDAEPLGVPNLLGFTRADLVARYGNPSKEEQPGGRWGFLFFENGLLALLEENYVKAYGVYARTPPPTR